MRAAGTTKRKRRKKKEEEENDWSVIITPNYSSGESDEEYRE